MNRFLLFLGVVLVALLAALFAVPAAIDWNSYRGTIERQTTALLGREVRIGGSVQLQLLPTPYLQLENIRIADQNGRFDRPLLRLGGFTLWLSIAPLLRGDLEVRDIELTQPELRLAVDEAGRGNWQGLGQGSGVLPVTPGAVTLGGIAVEKGMLVLVTAGDRELARITGITGDLNATALNGPFRFKGTALLGGELRQVRLATGPLDEAAGVRIKTVISEEEAGSAVYTLDGLLTGLDGTPRFEGTAEAAFAMPGTATTTVAAATDETGDTEPAAGPSAVEVKSTIAATADGASFSDIVASFESSGRPQQIAGKAELTWDGATRVTAELGSQWLDLDRILVGTGSAGILQSLRDLSSRLDRAVPADATVEVAGRLAQANLGGASVSDIDLALTVSPEALKLSRLIARLPGQSRIELSGELGRDGRAGFSGPVRIHGKSLPRLAAWVVPGLQLSASTGERPFVIEGEAKLSDDGLIADGLRAEIAGTTLTSRVQYNSTEPRSLEIGLDSDRLDLRDVLDLPDTLTALRGWLAPTGGSSGASASEGSGLMAQFAGVDTRIDARIGQLLAGGGEMQDVVADIHKQAGHLDVARLELATASGLVLDVSGQLSDLSARPTGELRLMLEAQSPQSVAELAGFIELPGLLADGRRIGSLAPLRLAGNLVLGRRGGETSDFAIDGMAGSSRLVVSARADGPTVADSHVDLSASLDNPDETALLRQLFAGWGDVSAMPTSTGPGRLSVSASGVPGRGLTSVGLLDAVALNGRYDGSVSLADGDFDGTGRLSLSAPHSVLLTQLTGLHRLLPGDETPVRAETQLSKSGTSWRFDDARVDLAGVEAKAAGTIVAGDGKTTFDLDLAMAAASLARHAAVLAGAAPAGTATEAEGNLWSDAAIDFSALAGLEGKVRLSAGDLDVLYGLHLANARLEAELSGNMVRLVALSGEALGGKVQATGTLEKAPAGAAVAATVTLAGGRLDTLASDGTGAPRATGGIDATLNVSGRGLSPRGILALLEGGGEVRTSDGVIAALSPQAVDEAARVALSEPSELDKDRLAELLARDPLSGAYPFKAFSAALTVGDGVVKSEPIAFDAEQAGLTITTVMDLQSLRLDSEWVLKPNPVSPDKAPLPPVTFVYAGAVHDLGNLTPRIEAEALARELTARKFIGGAEQLDGLWPSSDEKQLKEGNADGAQGSGTSPKATLANSAADWDTVIQSLPAQ